MTFVVSNSVVLYVFYMNMITANGKSIPFFVLLYTLAVYF